MKNKFISVLWIPFVLLFLIFFSAPLGEYILRISSNSNITYILFTENIFNIAFWGLIIFCFIILGFYFYKMLGKDSDFSARSIEANINSHKVTKNCIKSGFSKDYYYVDSFLSNFDEDIISVDKTHSDKTEEIIGYYEQAEMFKNTYDTD